MSVFGSYLLLSGVSRLLVEFVRINPPFLVGLTEAQVFAIVSILLGAFFILSDHLRHQATDPDTTAVKPLVAAQKTND